MTAKEATLDVRVLPEKPATLAAADEMWRPVPGWEHYKISDSGRLRGHRDRILRGLSLGDGYRGISLCRNAVQQRRYIHDLVLTAFVGPRPSGYYGCHNNGDKTDNRLVNLRWDTPRNNNLDQHLHGTNFEAKKTHCPRGHILAHPNLVLGELRRKGGRKCRACNQARAYAQAHCRQFDPTVADARFERIMREAAA